LIALLDTSALVKLVVHEDGTPQLRTWLAHDVVPAASTLVRTELRRATVRLDPHLLPFVEQVLGRLHLLRLDDDVLDLAATLPPPTLRTLEALHVATALRSGADVLVTYDRRTADAARGSGVSTVTP